MVARVSQAMLDAMELIEKHNFNPSQAALKAGLHPSTVIRSKLYKEWKKKKEEQEQAALQHNKDKP